MNTKLKTKTKKEFEKDSFKLMNNSVCGKIMDNIENRADVKSVTEREVARKLAAKPNFKQCTIFNENLTTINMKKTVLYHNKPVYLGMCVLDLSKKVDV